MWKVIAESVEGTSHRRISKSCQDHCCAQALQVGSETVLIVACADGAGSAELSEVGSRLACDRFFDAVHAAMVAPAQMTAPDRATLLGWYRSVHQALADEAAHREVSMRKLACTLLTAIVGETFSAFAQVGDGSIVFLVDRQYESVFWPQTGEYANITNFITDPDFEGAFEFVDCGKRIDELAVFTDGLQRLALSFATKSVHQPFFEPMFAQLRGSEHADELVIPLRAFLDSPVVNDRTDDDKTLVLATRLKAHASATL
jgi:hypothetical protein